MAIVRPDRVIHARAPIRINDIGAWTDTWFAGKGRVLNAAVLPGVEVQIAVFRRRSKSSARVAVHAENFAEVFAWIPTAPAASPTACFSSPSAACLPARTWPWRSAFIPRFRPEFRRARRPPSAWPCSAR